MGCKKLLKAKEEIEKLQKELEIANEEMDEQINDYLFKKSIGYYDIY